MDFALSTILLVFLLLPGLSFRRFYYTEEFSKEYFKESIPSFFISVILPCSIIHILGWQVVRYFYNLDINTLGILFSGTDNSSEITKALYNIYRHSWQIILYFFLLSIFGALFGAIAKAVIRRKKWDRKYKIFRFQNEWHYLFSGEILDFERVPGEASEIDFTYVDVLTETPEGSVIYTGVLADYLLSKDGGIDRIYLTDAKRRFLRNDNKGKDCYYILPGKFFIIPFKSVINLHLTYYSLEINPQLKEELKVNNTRASKT